MNEHQPDLEKIIGGHGGEKLNNFYLCHPKK